MLETVVRSSQHREKCERRTLISMKVEERVKGRKRGQSKDSRFNEGQSRELVQHKKFREAAQRPVQGRGTETTARAEKHGAQLPRQLRPADPPPHTRTRTARTT